MHLEKRYEVCSTNPTRFCDDGWYCTSSYTCRKKANYAWVAGVGVLVLLLIILSCWKRVRNRNAAQSQQTVVTVVDNAPPPTGAPYGANFAPPAGDPNMAYQTPMSYPPAPAPYGAPPAGAYPPPATYPPPAGAYTEKPIGSPYPAPMDAPMPYSAYPPASGAFSPAYPAPSGSSPYPPPTSPAPAYPSPSPAYPSPAPAPYPVHQGEAATFAPPPPK
ncbi:hypothetical protein BGW38_010299 [Lunasporangiospora selenospora]|uniref:Uncharacterized protein n=1 Tax=Lunasporangiospora selenospora TaxID=979761 RepID=A0A9P6G205_9FUNG|nr:hypothetical protein BGW38_010299 [Lunasporangiospora selenospora]